tara:strand:+ start:162 stop:866 length:705 start_codon:yes stop_codon:yes gene_type:complete
MTELSIIIPVFNEKNTILSIIDKINKLNINKQIIVVDDFSTDGTKEILKNNNNKMGLLLFHNKNLGKGAAIQSAQKYIKGHYTIIQDADLEYDPNDYYPLLDFIKKNNLKVLYGSRVLPQESINKKRVQNFSNSFRIFGNYLLTLINNIINKQKLTDAHTCYKLFDSKLFKSIKLEELGFAFCPEITTKLSKMNIKIKEIPINYTGRSYKEGKKISTIDGIKALFAILKYRYIK